MILLTEYPLCICDKNRRHAIVNPPQATILAIGSGERRAIVRGNDIVIEQQMTITLSTDHRAVDGALGAEFIGAIKAYLEEPGLMLV